MLSRVVLTVVVTLLCLDSSVPCLKTLAVPSLPLSGPIFTQPSSTQR